LIFLKKRLLYKEFAFMGGFFHHSANNMTGFKSLEEGARVSFDIEQSDRGPAAKNVTRL